jgi:hypothetical protein
MCKHAYGVVLDLLAVINLPNSKFAQVTCCTVHVRLLRALIEQDVELAMDWLSTTCDAHKLCISVAPLSSRSQQD